MKEQVRSEKDMDLQLVNRLILAIKLLLKENPMLPVGFKFKNECLLENMQALKVQLRKPKIKI